MRELLLHWSAAVDLQSADGFTPLQETAFAGFLPTARALLQAGARRDVRTVGSAGSFLHRGALTAAEWAREKGHADTAAAIDAFHPKRPLPRPPHAG